MILTRTPYRVSFCGGGSDYETFYSKFGGAVLTTTIDKHCYVALRRTPAFAGSKYRVQWAKTEGCDRLEEIEHNGVRGCLQYLDIKEGVEVVYMGDLPARSGLGSSSAFVVGMLHALHLLCGDAVGKFELAKEAIAVEQDVLKETVGIQDQIECAFGGLNHIKISTDGAYIVEPLMISAKYVKEIEDHLMLVYTGTQRYASEIAAAQVDNIERKEKELHELAALVPTAVRLLTGGYMKDFGAILHETWMLKRELSDKITTPDLDGIYETARRNGAWGGKLLGAGGGGFFLFCVPPERRQKMLDAMCLSEMAVPFKIEHRGSQIVQA